MGESLGDVRSTVASAPVEQVESDRVLAKVEVGLGLDPDLLTKCLLEVPVPFPDALVPVVERRRDSRVKLDLGVAQGRDPLHIPFVEGVDDAAVSLHVLRRHSNIRAPKKVDDLPGAALWLVLVQEMADSLEQDELRTRDLPRETRRVVEREELILLSPED